MAQITDHVDVQAILKTSQAIAKAFGLGLFLVDDEQIPVDLRRVYTSSSSYDDYDSSSEPYKYSRTFFAQKRRPTQLMLGRWVKVASKVYYVCGAGYETDYTVWKAITDGSFQVTDGTNTDVITACDFSGITSLNDILAIMNAKLAALVPTVTDLDSATFKFDSQGRLILEMITTGSTADTIEIEGDATGTSLETVMDLVNGIVVAGVDAEEPEEALAAISEIDDSYYNVNLRGESIDQAVALAQYVETKEKVLDLFVTDSNAKSAAATTDVGYRCKALSLKRTMCIYTEKTAEYPDGAVNGCVLPTEEGSTSFAFEVLSQVTDSGLTKPLTETERNVLTDKNYVWIEDHGNNNVILYDGVTSGGEEKRIMIGRDWYVARIREGIFTSMLNLPKHAFDNPTMDVVEGVIRDVSNEALDRGIIVDTAERPLVINIPDADDFTAAERSSRLAELEDAFSAYINSAINDYRIIGSWYI